MASVKDNVSSLIDFARKFSEGGGPADSAFKQLYMEEIKKIEEEVRNSEKADEYLSTLRKNLVNNNRSARERIAYLLGELMLRKPSSKEIDQCVNKLIECAKDKNYFQPVNTVGREIVNALGKSGKSEVEITLLQLVNEPTTTSIRSNILVALGKTGGARTVTVLTDIIKRPNLTVSGKIYLLWALGRLGSVQNSSRPNFPLSRSLFETSLKHIFQIIQSGIVHPDIHYCAIYAVGEICDQRDTKLLSDGIPVATLKVAEKMISSVRERRGVIMRSLQKNRKFESKAERHTRNILDICEKVALKMIRGQQLDQEGEKILLGVRILFDVGLSPDIDKDIPESIIKPPLPDESQQLGVAIVRSTEIPLDTQFQETRQNEHQSKGLLPTGAPQNTQPQETDWQNERQSKELLSLSQEQNHPQKEAANMQHKKVFLSYSYRQEDKELVEGFKVLLEDAGYEVITGEKNQMGSLSKSIKEKIKQADKCVVVMTCRDKKDNGKYTTSSWLLEEKGLAIAYDIPCLMLVEEGIEEKDFGGLQGDDQRLHFSRNNFALKVAEAIRMLR